MTIIVPHHKSKKEVIGIIDKGADELFASAGGGGVQIVDQQKVWNESIMSFSFKGRMGFVSVPLSGTVDVDDQNVTINCDLPPMLKNFIGEAKVQSAVSQKVKGLIGA
ncbi:MAG: polyhydroxyalkanoic acid system family protein [Acidobacteriota bacterium]|nr:polyhydroxyalkanoic acid system family protein [Acidobacteriota bacterium]